MQGSSAPLIATLSTPLRLLIAFILGVLVGLVFFFDAQATAFLWWMVALPAAVLFIAMLLSILLDPAVRQGKVVLLRPLISLVLLLLSASAIVWALSLPSQPDVSLIVGGLPQFVLVLATVFAIGLPPFALGLAAAFTIGGNGRVGLAVVGALAAWLGSAIPIVLFAVLAYIAIGKLAPECCTGASMPNYGDYGVGLILPITIVFVVIAFGVTALGGLVGGLLRNW